MFGKVGIYGIGLIGGSLGMDLRERGLAEETIGIGRNPERLEKGVHLGCIDRFTTDLSEVLSDLDVLVLATPLGTYRDILRKHYHAITPRTLVTDAGSAKSEVLRIMDEELPPDVPYAGAHPMAGGEKSGVEYSQRGLYEEATCAVCAGKRTGPEAMDRVASFWKAVGCRVIRMSPEEHDRVVAMSSHVPHLVAAVLAGAVAHEGRLHPRVMDLLGNGFLDSTRIAAGNAVMWRDICIQNRDAILQGLDAFRDVFERICGLVREGDEEKLEKELEAISRFREGFFRADRE